MKATTFILVVFSLALVNCASFNGIDLHSDLDMDALAKIPAHAFAVDVNSKATTWKAGFNQKFAEASLADVANLCGTFIDKEEEMKLPEKTYEEFDVTALPDNFDARTGFSECASVIGHIRDQADCGSCWAFGSTEAFNDRLCIKSKGAFTTLLSTGDTTACCDLLHCFSFGCGGGQPSAAWSWFVNYGVVTGGQNTDTGKDDTCKPYFWPECAHHVSDPKIANCSSSESSTPACKATCSNTGYKTAYAQDKIKASKSYSVSGVANIQNEIMTNGPVTGAFTVYADFPTYKSGVYKHVSGSELGGHAIKIMGWGVENGQDYWLVANSWNQGWGDGGTFKIARGTNECGIENQISAGLA